LAPLILLLGCGDRLVDGRYPGEPLLTVGGQVLVSAALDSAVNPEITLLWTNFAGSSRVESSLQVDTHFPSAFTLSVFQPPPDSVIGTPVPGGATLALGVFLLYDDTNGDAAFTVGSDPPIGAGEDAHVAWFLEPGAEAPWAEAETYYVDHALPSCGPPPEGADPPEPGVGAADLVVSDACTLLPDWNCDGTLQEWADLCPEG
jgi:hypothetical protein